MAHGWNPYIHSLSSDTSTVRVPLNTEENLAQHGLIGHNDFSHLGGSQGAPSSGSNLNYYPDPNANPDFVQQKYYSDIPWRDGHQAVQEQLPTFRDGTHSDFATGRITSGYPPSSLGVDLNLHRPNARQDCAMLNRSFLEYSDVSSNSSTSDDDNIEPYCQELNNESHRLSDTQDNYTVNVPLKESVCAAVCSESSWAEKLPPLECEQTDDLGAAEKRIEKEEHTWLHVDQPSASKKPDNVDEIQLRGEIKRRDLMDREESNTKDEHPPDSLSAASRSPHASESDREEDMDNPSDDWEYEKNNCLTERKETCVQADQTRVVAIKNLPASESEMDADMPDDTQERGQQPEEDCEEKSKQEEYIPDSVSGTPASRSVSPDRSEMNASMPDDAQETRKPPEGDYKVKSKQEEYIPDSVSGTPASKSVSPGRSEMDADLSDDRQETRRQPEEDHKVKSMHEEHVPDSVPGAPESKSVSLDRNEVDDEQELEPVDQIQLKQGDIQPMTPSGALDNLTTSVNNERKDQEVHVPDSVSGTPARKSVSPDKNEVDDEQELEPVDQIQVKQGEVQPMTPSSARENLTTSVNSERKEQEEHVPDSVSETPARKSVSPDKNEVDDEQESEPADQIRVKQGDVQPMTPTSARESLTTSVDSEPKDHKMACLEEKDVGFKGHNDDSITGDCLPLSTQDPMNSQAIDISDQDSASILSDCKNVSECSSGVCPPESQSQPELDRGSPSKMDTSSHMEEEQTSQEHCAHDKMPPDPFRAGVENAQGPFQGEQSTNDGQEFPMLSADYYGEPLSGEDSESATEHKLEAVSESCSVEGEFMTEDKTEHENAPNDMVPQLKSSRLMSKCLHPIVLLDTMELKNTEAFHCAECKHTTPNVDHIIEHHHCRHSHYKFQFCQTCDTYLTTDELAEHHLCGVDATQPVSVSHKCRICFKKFRGRIALKRHIHTHSDTTPYRCHKCGRCFPQIGNLNRHKRLVECSQSVKQGLVYKDAPSRNKAKTDNPCDLPECFVKLTDIYKSYFCTICLKNYFTEEKFRKHNSNVHSAWRLRRSNAEKQTTRNKKPNLAKAVTEKHSNPRTETKQHNILDAVDEKGEKYKCPLCPRVFNIFHNRARHLRTQCIKNATYGGKGRIGHKFQCPLCYATFNHQSNRRRHIKRTCLKEYCSKEFKRRKNPERNGKTQQAEEQKPPLEVTPRQSGHFECKRCPAVFAHYSGLYRHTKKHELFKYTGKVVKYRRSILPSQPKKTVSKDVLPLKEDDSLPISCKFCGKCFNTTYSLKKHVRRHKGRKPYRCVECGKCFAKEIHLLAHKKIHQRRIQCTVCKKILPTITELIQHRQSHIKKGVLQCPDCQMQFQYPVYLLRHMALHEQDETVKDRHMPTHQQKETLQDRPIATHKRKETLQDRPIATHKRKETPQDQEMQDQEMQDQTLRYCPICTEVFASSKALRIHCLEHSEASSRICPFCKRHFSQRQSMLRHMQVHTGEKPYSCQICKKRFFRNLAMKHHQSLCRDTGGQPEVIVSKAPYVEPPVTVSKGFPVKPPVIMNKSPKVKTAVMSKGPQVEPAGQQTWVCLYCPRKFERESRFKMHLHSHEMNSLLRCSKCGWFFGKNKFKSHEQNCNTVLYPCTGCGKNFTRNCNRTIHEKTCKMMNAPQNSVGVGTLINNQYKCPHCQTVFKYRSYLLRHLPTHNRENYSCIHCGQRYTRQSEYLEHEAFCDGVRTRRSNVTPKTSPKSGFREAKNQSPADGEGDYKCKFCTRSFMKSRSLRRHILTHTDVKPYRCKSCDSCFSRHDHLNRHLATCKGKRRRLQVCIAKISLDDIGKGWQKKLNLLNDKQLNEFKCSSCSKHFSNQSNLTRHFTLQHATKKPVCTPCGISFTCERSLRRHKEISCRMAPNKTEYLLKRLNSVTESRRELPSRGTESRRETNSLLQPKQTEYERKLKYPCTYCPRSFKSSEAMKTHTRLHTGERPYGCTNCGERFIRRDYLQRHSFKCNSRENRLDRALCERCGGVFSSDKLNAHQNSCTVKPAAPKLNSGKSPSKSPPRGFSCANCSSRFLLFSQLQQHFLSAHREETTLKSTAQTAPLHQQLSNMMSIKEEPLDDGYGDTNMSVENDLESIEDHTDEIDKPLSCPHCSMRFVNNGGLTRHMRTHTGKYLYTCRRCSKGFWNRVHYRKHIGKCVRVFARSIKEDHSIDAVIASEMGSTLNDSVLIFNQGSQTTGTGVLQTNFSCKDDVIDSTQENSTRNPRKGNSSDKNKAVLYQCSECDQSFADGLLLISHLEDHGREEQQQKLATCQRCGKKCSSPGNLERHMRMHANEKSYSCPECSKDFLTSSDLDIHRTCHDPNRPFGCIQCNQRFWTSQSLTNHNSEAHPEGAYTCHFCNKTYSHRASLVRHCRERHQTQPSDGVNGLMNKKEATDQGFEIEGNASASDDDESNDEDENDGSENDDSNSDEIDFPCHVCSKTFLTSECLEDHQRCHLGEKPHECAECGKCFFQAAQLQQHLRSHKSEYQCQICNRGFVSFFALRKHKHTHGKSRPHRCPKCHLSFTGPSQLAEHLATHREDNFPCDKCDRTFSCKISRAEHRKNHNSPPSATSLEETAVPSPTASSSKDEDLDYRCMVCKEHFKDPELLSKHRCMAATERSSKESEKINVHSLQSNRPFPEKSHSEKQLDGQKTQEYNYRCAQCHMSFAYRNHYRHHLKKHHGIDQFGEGDTDAKAKETDEEKIYKCPICPHRFAQALELSAHLTIHAKNSYECKSCKLTFPSKSKLSEHERCHLTAATQYECTECNQSFFGSDAFRQHHCSRRKRAVIDGERPHPSTSKSATTSKRMKVEEKLDVGEDFFNCSDCSKRFFLKHDLLEHRKKYHPSEQPLKCELCGKSFALKKYLNEHLRRHKLREDKEKKLLKCSQCPKSFEFAPDLQLHMRKHAEQEVGNHRCDMCYKSFSQLSRLREHQESHVGQVVYECTDCDQAFTVLKLLEEHQMTHSVPHV